MLARERREEARPATTRECIASFAAPHHHRTRAPSALPAAAAAAAANGFVEDTVARPMLRRFLAIGALNAANGLAVRNRRLPCSAAEEQKSRAPHNPARRPHPTTTLRTALPPRYPPCA